jgi:SAM-dependent methyltransferase
LFERESNVILNVVIWRWHGKTWDVLGERNALNAILTRSAGQPVWSLDDFFATGEADALRFMADLDRIAPGAGRARALDFGCGVGRITRALATYFEAVVGVDVAASMIQRARALNPECSRCTFVLNRAPHLRRFESGSFDVIYSRLVLQHVRPALARRYIPEFIRILAPRGVLMFQLPEFPSVVGPGWKRRLPRSIVTAWRRTKYMLVRRRASACVEMFGIDREDVERIVDTAGGRLLAVQLDRSHGSGGAGFEYWVTC